MAEVKINEFRLKSPPPGKQIDGAGQTSLSFFFRLAKCANSIDLIAPRGLKKPQITYPERDPQVKEYLGVSEYKFQI